MAHDWGRLAEQVLLTGQMVRELRAKLDATPPEIAMALLDDIGRRQRDHASTLVSALPVHPSVRTETTAQALRACMRKKRYRSLTAAGMAARSAKHRQQPGAESLRAYGCEVCGAFHLTSMELERFVNLDATT